jgi:hypothetical protein
MSDEKKNTGITESVSKLEGTLFIRFAKPYLDFIGKGKLFSLIYVIMAVLNLLLPFAVIFMVVESGILGFGGAEFIVAFILSWLVVAFACWTGFQLWWDRKSKVKLLENEDFIVTPLFSEIIQTFGEWLGTLIGIIGAGVGLIAAIFLGDYAYTLFQAIGMGFMPSGIVAIVAGPLTGFLIIILSRFVAEQLRLLVALVNNTKLIALGVRMAKAGDADHPSVSEGID